MTKTTVCQHDFQGRVVFQHRALDKWNLFRHNIRDPEFLMEDLCLEWLAEIRSQWDRKDTFYRFSPPSRLRRRQPPRSGDRRASAADFTLVTLYDAGYRDLARVTAARMKQYATRHGYGFVQHAAPLDPSRHPAWNKILAVSRLLNQRRSKWIVWVDADAVIMNFDQRLEDLVVEGRDVVFGSDFNGLNSAVFLARNCDWSRRFFETVFNLGDIQYQLDRCGAKWEQNTIKHLLLNFAGFEDHVAIHPERHMNARDGVYQDGDFILHLGGMSMAQRLGALKELDLL